MKKIVLLVIFFIFTLFFIPAKADILPLSTKSIKYYGVGVLNMPRSYTVYQYPYFDAKILREVNYESLKKSAIVNSVDMRKVSYVAYVPSEDIALMTVFLDSENGWYSVYLDQETGETGWVYNDDKYAFSTYRQLFYKYGKKYGIRIFNDVPKENKILYARESQKSKVLTELTYPTHIDFTIIRGNWLLATVNDMTKQAKIGWFKWRNDDGTLNMFPNFKN